jgi:hypothetical protein
MLYEVEKLFLTDPAGNPAEPVDHEIHSIEASTAKTAALLYIEQDGARLLGSVCDAPGDQCTAVGWADGRAYAITVWLMGHRPEAPLARWLLDR